MSRFTRWFVIRELQDALVSETYQLPRPHNQRDDIGFCQVGYSLQADAVGDGAFFCSASMLSFAEGAQ